MFALLGKIEARPEQGSVLAERLLQAAALMEAESGCQLYAVCRSDANDDEVWVLELWNDEASHAASLERADVRELIVETMPILDGPPHQTRLTPIGGKGIDGFGTASGSGATRSRMRSG